MTLSRAFIVGFVAFCVVASTPFVRGVRAQGGGALPGVGGSGAPSGDELVDFRMAVEHSPMNPSAGTTLALIWEVEEGWHVYWKNNGDTGMPLGWELELPAGIEAGEPRWPAPERYVSGGFIVDHVLEGEVVVLVPLRVSSSARASMESAGVGELTVRASSEWLVCKEACLPGSGSGEVSFSFAESAADEQHDELFARARAALPVTRRALRERGDRAASRVTARFVGGALEVSAPGAAKLRWFADPSEAGVRPADRVEDCAVEGDRMRIPYSGPVSEMSRVGGVLRAWYGSGEGERSVAVRIDVPGPASDDAGTDPLAASDGG
jgi:thiol:disulfide interchange protein DsbD